MTKFKKLDLELEKSFFLKIDTEGSDYNILKGGKNFLKKNNPIIFPEINKYNDFLKINNLLRKFNYSPYIWSNNSFIYAKNEILNKKNIITDKYFFLKNDIFFLNKKSFNYLKNCH